MKKIVVRKPPEQVAAKKPAGLWLTSPAALASVAALVLATIAIPFNAGPVLRAFAVASAFALPYLVAAGWKNFNLLFEGGSHKVWELPTVRPAHNAVLFVNSVPVEIRMTRPFPGGVTEAAPLIAPSDMKLGDVFFHFLEDNWEQQKKVLPGGKLAWSFYTTRIGRQARYLDPDMTMEENKITSNSVITATPQVVTPILTASVSKK
jgi:hypothetical protein